MAPSVASVADCMLDDGCRLYLNSPGEARQAPLAETAEGAKQPHAMDPTAEGAGEFSRPVPSADATGVATQASAPTIPSTDTAKFSDDCKSSKGLFSGSKKRKRSTAAVSARSGLIHIYISHNTLSQYCNTLVCTESMSLCRMYCLWLGIDNICIQDGWSFLTVCACLSLNSFAKNRTVSGIFGRTISTAMGSLLSDMAASCCEPFTW